MNIYNIDIILPSVIIEWQAWNVRMSDSERVRVLFVPDQLQARPTLEARNGLTQLNFPYF